MIRVAACLLCSSTVFFITACGTVAVSEDGKKAEKETSLFGYQFGPPSRYDTIKTICIPRIENMTREPHLQMEATNLIIDEFTREQTYTVVSHTNTADAVLYVTLSEIDKSTVRYMDRSENEREKGIPVEFRVRVVADVRMVNPRTNNLIWRHRSIRGKYDFQAEGDFGTAERDALIEACKDLAMEINQAAVERW